MKLQSEQKRDGVISCCVWRQISPDGSHLDSMFFFFFVFSYSLFLWSTKQKSNLKGNEQQNNAADPVDFSFLHH